MFLMFYSQCFLDKLLTLLTGLATVALTDSLDLS